MQNALKTLADFYFLYSKCPKTENQKKITVHLGDQEGWG